MIDVSIIIVNYHTSSLVKDILLSIKEHTKGVKYETIIIDNSNDVNEFKTLKQLDADKVIDAKDNVGFGKANNIGTKEAKGKCLLFLNADTALMNDAISIMYEYLNNSNASIVGPNLYKKDLSPNISYELEEKNIHNDSLGLFKSAIRRLFKKNYFFNHSNSPKEIKGYVSGAALMIKKEVFEQIGGFDERIFMYADEALLCAKARRENKKIYNVPNAKIIHFEGGSFSGWNAKRAKMFVDGNFIYYTIMFGEQVAHQYLCKSLRNYCKKAKFSDNKQYNKLMIEAYQNKINELNGGK